MIERCEEMAKSEESRLLFFDKQENDEITSGLAERRIARSIKIKNSLKAIGEWAVKLISSFVVCLLASLLVSIIFNSVQENISLTDSFYIVINKVRDWISIYL